MRWICGLALLATLGLGWEVVVRAPARVLAAPSGRPSLPETGFSTPSKRVEFDSPDAPAAQDRSSDPKSNRADWIVTVLGADLRPIEGIGVEDFKPAGCSRTQDILDRTDVDGRVIIPPPKPPRGELPLLIGGELFTVSASRETVVLDDRIPVQALILDRRGRATETGAWPDPTHVARGGADHVSVFVELDGSGDTLFVASPGTRFVSPLAERVRVVVPPHVEAPIRIKVVDARGNAVRNATVIIALAPARPRFAPLTSKEPESSEPRLPETIATYDHATDAAGAFDVPHVQFLQGERIGFLAYKDGRHGYGEIVLGRTPRLQEIVLRLPAQRNRMLPPRKAKRKSRVLTAPLPQEEGTAGLTVRVARRNGRPAAGAMVRAQIDALPYWARVDAEGVARFRDLPEGDAQVEVRTPGFVSPVTSVTLTSGGQAHVNLLEGPGWSCRVLVLDHDGHRVPFASLDVDQAPGYVLLDGDTQILNPHTDHAGEAMLPGLSQNTVRIHARFGSRTAARYVDRSSPSVVLRLPAAE